VLVANTSIHRPDGHLSVTPGKALDGKPSSGVREQLEGLPNYVGIEVVPVYPNVHSAKASCVSASVVE
jgi:hypothetical protein